MNKSIIKLQLLFLAKVCIVFSLLIFNSNSEEYQKYNNTVVIGPDEAVVKIKIFSSLTCPHCADFHTKVVPEIKKEYVESGKVQLIFVDFPLDQASFNASKLLHCLDQNKQIAFLDIIYENQSNWTQGSNINEINNNLKKIVEKLGINSNLFEKCLMNESISDKILNGRIDAGQKYSISSTPTIVINEKKLEGSASFKNIKKKIEKLI
tara:strand:- start:1050 stop:1673 length:624 start_codon:yes stop_codon:yes gene_type:complete